MPRFRHPAGSIREMISLALPMIVSYGCDTAMTFTDRLFLSRLGPEYMSAAMGGGVTVFMMMSFFLGLTGYVTALAAQYLGARQEGACARVLTQAVILSVVAYPLILACRPLAYLYFSHMHLAPIQLDLQAVYFDILLYGVIFSLFRNCLSSFFCGTGRTRVVMAASLGAMVVNIGLNYVLIFGRLGFPPMGIRGAAYGTIIGGLTGMLILAVVYLGRANRERFAVPRSWRFDRTVMVRLLRFGYPAGLEMFLNVLAFSLMIFSFHSQGLAAAAAATIVFNWDMVTFVPLIGIEVAVTSLVGRYMGAGTPAVARQVTRSGLKVGLVYAGIMFVLFAFFPGPLVRIFHPQGGAGPLFEQTYTLALGMVRLVALYVLAEVAVVVFIGALRGAGDTLWAMGLTVGIHWLSAIVLQVLLRGWGWSAQTSWAVVVGLFLVFAALPYLRFRHGAWRRIRVVEPAGGLPPLVGGDGFHEVVDL